MQHYSIAIIGMGSRGLSVLERFAARLNSNPIDAAVTIHVVDPGFAGEGIHKASQPSHLLTNTTAASITAYCDRSVAGVKALLDGPSFHEWLTERGSRSYAAALGTNGNGETTTGDCFPPRCVLGAYLQWAYQDIVRRLPPNVLVEHHGCIATDICEMDDETLKVRLGQGEVFADFVYLATGHAGCGPDELDELWSDWCAEGRQRNGKVRYFPTPYPLDAIDAVAPDSKVAICGAGLTAIDIVSMLTTGRGGRFVSNAAGFSSYVPSGREPRIVLFSRQGLPPCGKPMPQSGGGWPYAARFFTPEFIDKQRVRTRNGQLDWSRDLYPTLRKEMAYVYCCTERGAWLKPAGFEIDDELSLALERLLAPLSHKRFADQADYQAFLARYIRDDVVACSRGKLTDPGKAVTEMIRDIQDSIRYAVDYAGLTAESHADFLQNWCSISNRIAAGPPKERNIELLALVEAGIVSFFGPAPRVEFDSSSGRYCLVSTGNIFRSSRIPPWGRTENETDSRLKLSQQFDVALLPADLPRCGWRSSTSSGESRRATLRQTGIVDRISDAILYVTIISVTAFQESSTSHGCTRQHHRECSERETPGNPPGRQTSYAIAGPVALECQGQFVVDLEAAGLSHAPRSVQQ